MIINESIDNDRNRGKHLKVLNQNEQVTYLYNLYLYFTRLLKLLKLYCIQIPCLGDLEFYE